MSAVLKQIHDLLPALTEQERAQLAHELIVSLDGPEEDADEVEAAWEVEIERRLAEVEIGTVKLIDGDEFMRRLDARVSRHR